MKLKELVDINPVGNGKLPNLIAYIDTSSVTDGELTNIQYLQDTFPSRAQRKISNGDILISSVRPNLKHNYYVQNATENMIASTGFIQIRVKNNEKVDSRFLYYWLTSPNKISHYCRIADCSQSSYPSFSKEVIEELDFSSIPLVAQHSITNILGTIDNAIANYQNRITKIEKINAQIFNYMLANFSGVKYKLGEIASIYQPQTISEKELNNTGKYVVYGANGIIGKYDHYNHINPEIALTCRGATCGNVLITRPCSWITGNAMVISPATKSYQEYMFQYIKTFGVNGSITGSAQPQITRSNIEEYLIALPNSNKEFYNTMNSNRHTILKFLQCIEHLQNTKLFILPLLMNGQAHLN